MIGKQEMQADGDKQGAAGDGASDGVSVPASDGESSGGAYPNPHRGKEGGHFDGGQSHKAYEGPDNPNATTEADD